MLWAFKLGRIEDFDVLLLFVGDDCLNMLDVILLFVLFGLLVGCDLTRPFGNQTPAWSVDFVPLGTWILHAKLFKDITHDTQTPTS
jgi:hypothetical protein